MTTKTCQICGKNSGIYPLCKEHLEMKANGLVIKNEKTNKWELKNNSLQENSKCILCGNETKNNFKLCKDCFYKVEDRKESLDKNQIPQKLKDYYYNSKDYANRIFDESKILYQETTMIAIAQLLKDLHNDNSLYTERLENDINNINNNFKTKAQTLDNKIKDKDKIEKIKSDKNLQTPKPKQTQDGHFVESDLEQKVDDILYNLSKVHAYGIKVDEITERTTVCDWYIPVLQDKGIYIELWGRKNDPEYDKNKKEKIELYKLHNLKLFEITHGEASGDTKLLKSLIKSNITRLHNEINDENKI